MVVVGDKRISTVARLVAAFVVSRVAYALSGVRFIDGQTKAWQALDPALIQHDLARSLFYLHTQPPGFNLFVGSVQKLTPAHALWVFHAVFLGCGLTLYLALVRTMRVLGVSSWLSVALSTLFIVSPAAILYENWFFYTYPLATLLLLSVLALHAFIRTRKAKHAALFFFVIALLSLMQSSFHLAFFALLIAGLSFWYPAERKVIWLTSAPPFLLILLLYLKNAVLFGSFGVSSWVGMNMARVPFVNWPLSERAALVEQGRMSPVTLIEPFSPLDMYPVDARQAKGFEGIPLLSEAKKSTGEVNYNHLAYLRISKEYMRGVWYGVRHFPRFYVKGVLRSAFIYTKAASDYAWLVDNRAKIRLVDELYDRVFLGRLLVNGPAHVRGASTEPLRIYVFAIFTLPLVFVFGLVKVLQPKRLGPALTRDQLGLVSYICVCIAYLGSIGILMESGENNRFRFMTDPLSLVLLALLLQTVLSALRERKNAMPGSSG